MILCAELGGRSRQKYVLDRKRMLGGKRGVLVRVALRIDDSPSARLLVSNNLGGVRQTRQIELLEDHFPLAFFADSWVGWGTIRR